MNGLNLAQELVQRLRGHWRRSLAEPLWGQSAIVALQHVLDSESEARLPHRAPWSLGPESFERLLVALSDVARLVSLPTAMQTHHDPRARIALTFDVGWRDVMDNALPHLEHYAIPASIFVNLSETTHAGGLWREVIGESLWQARSPQRVRDAMGDAGLPLPPMPPPHPGPAYSRALLAYFGQLQRADPQRLAEATGHVADRLDVAAPGLDPFSIRRLEAGGLIRFGARGVDALPLEPQSDERIRWQVQRSRHALARLCHEPLAVFAYPDPQPGTRVQQVVSRCGVQLALTGSGGWLSHRDNPLALPRIPVSQPIAQSPGRLFDYLLGSCRDASGTAAPQPV